MDIISKPNASQKRRFVREYEEEIWRLYTALIDYAHDCGYPLLQYPSFDGFVEFVVQSSLVSGPACPSSRSFYEPLSSEAMMACDEPRSSERGPD